MLNRSKVISSNSNNQNINLTLPITCQICLGRVKDPSVCPNLHAFCSVCIDLWLQKSKQCPTCRTNITQETPCRRILGGIENQDEVDVLKPSDFSHESVRKARYLNIFQQYEDEIERLSKYIDSLNSEISTLKETNKGSNNSNISNNSEDLQIINSKLEQIQKNFDETQKEKNKLNESNKKLESENSILMQDIMRLKVNLSEKNSQISNRYTVAALETKVENYEKEIKKLQKALERSDKYIADLEQNKNTKRDTNDIKEVKDLLTDKIKLSKPVSLSSSLSVQNFGSQQGLISKDNFYGSPSKMASISNVTTSTISSFSDRLKKMNQSVDLEAPSPLSQSLVSDKQTNILNNDHQPANNSNWFSPMKRLRLDEKKDEFILEKPSFNGEDTLNSTNYTIQSNNDVKKTPPNNKSPVKYDMDSTKKIIKLNSNATKSAIISSDEDRNFQNLFNYSYLPPSNYYDANFLTPLPSAFETTNSCNPPLYVNNLNPANCANMNQSNHDYQINNESSTNFVNNILEVNSDSSQNGNDNVLTSIGQSINKLQS